MPTSVPVWRTTAPGLDTTGRRYAVLAFGEQAHDVARNWAEGDPAGLRWAQRQAEGARVGWRFCVAGPEADVLAACAAVRARGALDAEITAHALDASRKNVLCAHCRTTTATTADTGGTCPCTGCGRELLVYDHVSRRHASYLGFMADAEERP